GGVTSEQMQAEFSRQGRYTAGLATTYRVSALTGEAAHQDLATGFEIGTRFHSSPAVRVADGKRMQLGYAARADGRWRIYAFGDADGSALRDFATWLGEGPESPVTRFTPAGAD